METYFSSSYKKISLCWALFSILIIFTGQAQESAEELAVRRELMVKTKIQAKGIFDPRVLGAMLAVERHIFVPEYLWPLAYEDIPLPISKNQFMAEPSLLALIAQKLELDGSEQILVVGTGSGYLCAILAYLVRIVYTTELNNLLFIKAQSVFGLLELKNIQVRLTDGYFGWQEETLFDCIVINGAVDHIPAALLRQLKQGGRLILPLGDPFGFQNLVIVIKQVGNLSIDSITDVIFSPLFGQALVP